MKIPSKFWTCPVYQKLSQTVQTAWVTVICASSNDGQMPRELCIQLVGQNSAWTLLAGGQLEGVKTDMYRVNVPRPKKPRTDSSASDVRNTFIDQYTSIMGYAPLLTAKALGILRGLTVGHTPDVVIQAIQNAFQDTWFVRTGPSVGLLVNNFTKYTGASSDVLATSQTARPAFRLI